MPESSDVYSGSIRAQRKGRPHRTQEVQLAVTPTREGFARQLWDDSSGSGTPAWDEV